MMPTTHANDGRQCIDAPTAQRIAEVDGEPASTVPAVLDVHVLRAVDQIMSSDMWERATCSDMLSA